MKIKTNLLKDIALGAGIFLLSTIILGIITISINVFLLDKPLEMLNWGYSTKNISSIIFPMFLVNNSLGQVLAIIILIIVSILYPFLNLWGEQRIPEILVPFIYIATTLTWGAFLGAIWYFSKNASTIKRYIAKSFLLFYILLTTIVTVGTLFLNTSCQFSNDNSNCDFGLALLFSFIYGIIAPAILLISLIVGYSYGHHKKNTGIVFTTTEETSHVTITFKKLFKYILIAIPICIVLIIIGNISNTHTYKVQQQMFTKAVEENIPSLCEGQRKGYSFPTMQEQCYYQVAIKHNNIEACKYFESEEHHSYDCYGDVARHSNNKSMCELIELTYLKNQCLDYFKEETLKVSP